MKLFMLLIKKLTYIPVPVRLRGNPQDLPKAMRLLPLLGLFCGALIYLASILLEVMPSSGAAAVMVGLNVIFGGAFLLRDLITVADGLSIDPLYPPNMAADTIPSPEANMEEVAEKERRFNTGKAGLTWGIIWLIALYCLYLWYFRSQGISNFAFIVAPVISRWLMSWTIYYFYAIPPAWLHRNFKRKDFVISSLLALLFVLPFSRVSLYMAILISFLGIYIFATYRQRTVGGLDDACYGASCAWAEILFLLAWMAFDRLF